MDAQTKILSGVAGLVAGAFSMALGEYTSVSTSNEQIDAEVRVERGAQRRLHPEAEEAELVETFTAPGQSEQTATATAAEVHARQ